MNPRVGRRQYLVTYSQADESKFSTREIFGKMSETELNASTSVVRVDYWACSREEHQNHGSYYHCALKLTGRKKWLSVKIELHKNMIFKSILVTKIISICLHKGMPVKVTKRELTVKTRFHSRKGYQKLH